MADLETEPLLRSRTDSSTTLNDAEHYLRLAQERKLENDVVPETAATGRRIGWTSAFILVISRVIGSGIFAMPGTIVQNVGSPGLALVLWVAGALIAWCGLAIDLEYGCMLPRSGGTKVYLEFTYPWPRFLASTMIAISAVLLGFTASNCIVFAKYILFAFGKVPNDFEIKTLAIVLLTFITIVHGCFYRAGIFIQNALGWLKLALIFFMIVTGFFVVLLRKESELSSNHVAHSYSDLFKDSDWSFNTLSTAFFKIFYSYAGLSNINNVMNEVKNPIRTLKTVAPTALMTSCILYVLINVAYMMVVPLTQIKESRELIAALFFEKVFGQGFGNVFLPVAVALSAAGNVMVVTFSLARVNQEVARQGFLPYARLFASSEPFGAPLGGLIVHYIPSVLVIVLPPSSTVYAFIADVEGYVGQFFVVAVAAGLILLRYNKPELMRPFKAWLPGVWIRIVLSAALIIAPLFPPKSRDVNFFYAAYALVGLSILIFGLIYWYVWTVIQPYFRGYRLEEQAEILPDGTSRTTLIRRKRHLV